MTLIRTYKYKLKPTKGQVERLTWTLDRCRELYNAALEERVRAYKKAGKSFSNFEQMRELKDVKQALPEYKEVNAQVLGNVIDRLSKAYKAFFARVKRGEKAGFPRFKGRNRYDSFTYRQSGHKISEAEGKATHLYLQNIGNVRISLCRPVEGKIKTCTIKRDACGDWWATFACEVTATPLPKTGSAVGLDMGLTDIVATSDGELVEAPKHFQKMQKALAKAQRRLARKKRGSKNREKAKLAVAKIHRKIKRQRLDFLHKTTTKIIEENDLIAIEDLNIKGLARGMLAKSVNDVAWGTLKHMLEYKAECADRTVVKVNPQYTSQECPQCGRVQKKTLSKRWHKCACGCEGNRDVIAARVILKRALEGYQLAA